LYQNKPLIQHVYDVATSVFSDVAIVTENKEKYSFLNARCITDIIHGLGPISGLYSALEDTSNESVFLFPCDTPFLNSSLIKYMINQSDNYDITVPHINNYYEPLHAIYSKKCIKVIEENIKRGDNQIFSIYNSVRVRKIIKSEITQFGDDSTIFKNVNYQNDLP